METALSWEEVQDLVISYGFVEDLYSVVVLYTVEVNNITYTFRESRYGYYLLMDNKHYKGIKFPFTLESEDEFMGILKKSDFHELYNFMLCYKRKYFIDKLLFDFKNEGN